MKLVDFEDSLCYKCSLLTNVKETMLFLLLCVAVVSGQLCQDPDDENCLIRKSGVCAEKTCHSCPNSPESWRQYPVALYDKLVISESCVPGFDGGTGDGVVDWNEAVVINSFLNIMSENEKMTIRGICPLFYLDENGDLELDNVHIDCTSGREAIIILGKGNWIVNSVSTNARILISGTAVDIGLLVATDVEMTVATDVALVLEETSGDADVTCVSNETRVYTLPNSGTISTTNCKQINLLTQLSYIGFKFVEEFIQNSAFDYTDGLVSVLIVLAVISAVTIVLLLFQWSSNYYRKKNN